MLDWFFRSRETGRITIAQFPNLPLGVFLAASLLRRLVRADGGVDTTLRLVAAGGLAWWAADELLRGVNPFRRLLGGTVLAVQVTGLVR